MPEIIPYDGNWAAYLTRIYAKYEEDFVKTRPLYRGTYLRVKRLPKDRGLDATFWHLVEKGKDSRILDFRRCERIPWPKPIVGHCDETCIKTWENTRNGERRICIWYESAKYLVVLAKRTGYILFWTAYIVEDTHTEIKLRKEYEGYIAGAATSSGPVTPSTRGR
ncbi:hypothetical protein IMZ48_47450 [Candidatus Bathyarchaeota archaeon]|nr:hypothetical protein [Candidatus Bathyarchaeota archaeon]